MHKEYNLLTQRLLAEGYTAENYPGYVEVCRSSWGKELWQNLAGGFEYTREYLKSMVFKTGCGLLIKGDRFTTGSMSYMGKDWRPENDNPVIGCPYRKCECDLRDPILDGLAGGTFRIIECDCHQTDEAYCYERSVDKVRDEESYEMRQKYDAYAARVKGHTCHWHMRYDYVEKKWKQRYDPMVCSRYCQRVGGICGLTHKPVSKKRGNVFYDVRISYIRHDGTLFDGEEVVIISKGNRLFEIRKSITICEQVAKRCARDIQDWAKNKYHRETLLFGWKVEVLNIRVEQRESRDLMQDLQDIREGIEVIHASDSEKQAKEIKKMRRQQAKEKRIKAIEKRILDIGYEGMEWVEQNRAHKLLDADRIEELEAMREENQRKEWEEPVQMNIFDMM